MQISTLLPHVGLDAFFEPVKDGAQVQVLGFDMAEVPARRT